MRSAPSFSPDTSRAVITRRMSSSLKQQIESSDIQMSPFEDPVTISAQFSEKYDRPVRSWPTGAVLPVQFLKNSLVLSHRRRDVFSFDTEDEAFCRALVKISCCFSAEMLLICWDEMSSAMKRCL